MRGGRLGRYVPVRREAEDPAAVRHRGELVMGMRLQQERAADRAAGRPHRELWKDELRCLAAVEQAELRGGAAVS